ncbi:hypothetical protein [Bernardetia sp.]|uniref:hypothetical protein n=1 Tax=Bernardetia sp. TaxID=1937974 RepID=UPI0025B81F4C|nr:hypothetical protein [Bernardetia sp.]
MNTNYYSLLIAFLFFVTGFVACKGKENKDSTTETKTYTAEQLMDVRWKATSGVEGGEELNFAKDAQKGELSYQRIYGEGTAANTVTGYWKIEDGNKLVLEDWDAAASTTKPAETYTIESISDTELVLVSSGGNKRVYSK